MAMVGVLYYPLQSAFKFNVLNGTQIAQHVGSGRRSIERQRGKVHAIDMRNIGSGYQNAQGSAIRVRGLSKARLSIFLFA